MIWYFDSGASMHINSRKDLFCSLDAAPAGKKVTCANNASYPIRGVGTLENGLFVLDRYEKQIQACIAETKTQAMQDAELWHARFGHVGYGSLMTLQRHNMVHDLSLLEMPPRHVCEGCVLGKMHRFAFSQDGSVRATRKLQLVHSDVCGPMRTPSVENSIYFVTFIDDFSRFCWVYPLKAKSDVFAIFQHYVSMVENETGCKVQTLRTDRGGEYMSGAFKDFLGKKGIKHQCTMPYTPQQNGVAKRKNRSLMEMARCMLKAKSLPHKLWMEAVACAAHVLNRCPIRALKTITIYESWYDRKPSVSYLRVFGCLANAHIPQQLRGKLDDKAVKCIFVGYSSGSKGYRLYNPATNKIFESRDVIFAETTAQPMVAFDVPHMQTQDVFEGFLPSFVENQESQQVDNFDQSFDQHVTPHDVEEIVRKEQEVLREERTLPKWVQKTLQDSKLDAPLPRKTHAVAGVDVGAGLDNLVETVTRAEKRFGVANPGSSKKKSKKKKKKDKKKKRSSDDSSEKDSDSGSNSKTDTDTDTGFKKYAAPKQLELSEEEMMQTHSMKVAMAELLRPWRESIQSVEESEGAESGGDDAVEEMEVDEKFDMRDRETEGVTRVLISDADVDVLKKEVFDYTKELWSKVAGLFQDHMAKPIDKYRSWFEAVGEHKVREENAELRAWNTELEMKLESIRKELLEQQMSIQQGPQSVNVQESPKENMETIPEGSVLVVDVDAEPLRHLPFDPCVSALVNGMGAHICDRGAPSCCRYRETAE
ncbi:hypothetical protein L7F22_056557 [Adiantum nelumboides]|nr:hypothetical protein [Adiantum nelumboides]